MAHRFVCCIKLFLAQSAYAFAMPADFEFPKVDRTAGGVTLQGQPVNSGAPEIAIYLRTYLRMSFH